jgi:hypothetical protein
MDGIEGQNEGMGKRTYPIIRLHPVALVYTALEKTQRLRRGSRGDEQCEAQTLPGLHLQNQCSSKSRDMPKESLGIGSKSRNPGRTRALEIKN